MQFFIKQSSGDIPEIYQGRVLDSLYAEARRYRHVTCGNNPEGYENHLLLCCPVIRFVLLSYYIILLSYQLCAVIFVTPSLVSPHFYLTAL